MKDVMEKMQEYGISEDDVLMCRVMGLDIDIMEALEYISEECDIFDCRQDKATLKRVNKYVEEEGEKEEYTVGAIMLTIGALRGKSNEKKMRELYDKLLVLFQEKVDIQQDIIEQLREQAQAENQRTEMENKGRPHIFRDISGRRH